MTRKTIVKLILPLAFLTFAMGCTTIKNWWSGKKPSDSPPDVLAQEGIKDLQKKNYQDAAETFEKVRDRFPYSEQALMAQLKLADAYFYQKKYDEAIQAYKDFMKLHPTNKAVPYCMFRLGLCYYRQRSTIDRDQTYATKALEAFRLLKQKFPRSEFIPRAEKCMARCRLDLAEHDYYIANFYFKTNRYQAALDRYQGVIQDYPEFPHKAEAQAKIAECQKILARPDKKPKATFFTPIANLFDAKW